MPSPGTPLSAPPPTPLQFITLNEEALQVFTKKKPRLGLCVCVVNSELQLPASLIYRRCVRAKVCVCAMKHRAHHFIADCLE